MIWHTILHIVKVFPQSIMVKNFFLTSLPSTIQIGQLSLEAVFQTGSQNLGYFCILALLFPIASMDSSAGPSTQPLSKERKQGESTRMF